MQLGNDSAKQLLSKCSAINQRFRQVISYHHALQLISNSAKHLLSMKHCNLSGISSSKCLAFFAAIRQWFRQAIAQFRPL